MGVVWKALDTTPLDGTGDGPVIAFVGRMDEQKDPVLWVRAAERIARSLPDARFVMIGDGPLREDVARAVDECGSGRDYGWTKPISVCQKFTCVALGPWRQTKRQRYRRFA